MREQEPARTEEKRADVPSRFGTTSLKQLLECQDLCPVSDPDEEVEEDGVPVLK